MVFSESDWCAHGYFRDGPDDKLPEHCTACAIAMWLEDHADGFRDPQDARSAHELREKAAAIREGAPWQR